MYGIQWTVCVCAMEARLTLSENFCAGPAPHMLMLLVAIHDHAVDIQWQAVLWCMQAPSHLVMRVMTEWTSR